MSRDTVTGLKRPRIKAAHMRHVISVSLILVLFVSHRATAQDDGLKDGRTELQTMSRLFEGIWLGKGETGDGSIFESELAFERVMADRFIRVHNHIKVNGRSELAAMTIYGWQPVLKQVVFWVFDKDGTTGEGVATLSDSSVSHEWRTFGGNGEIKEWESKLVRQGSSLQLELADMKAGQVFEVVYHKKRK